MGSSLSSFTLEGDKPNMFNVHLLFVFFTALSLADSHGFFRGYRNSRTWGSGDQRQARTLGKARMGRQQGDNDLNSISVPSISPECAPCSPSSASGPVCGTDGKTYRTQCQLQQIACKMVRRQGRLQAALHIYNNQVCRTQFPEC